VLTTTRIFSRQKQVNVLILFSDGSSTNIDLFKILVQSTCLGDSIHRVLRYLLAREKIIKIKKSF